MHVDFDDLPTSIARHFFWIQIAPIQWWQKKQPAYGSNHEHPESITQFLTLPTIIARANPRSHVTDLVVDFTKSIMLTSDAYLDVV
jgi:hypothetical protein